MKTNHIKRGRPANVSGGPARALEAFEVRNILRAAQVRKTGLRDVALIEMCLCGLRISEPCAVSLGQVLNSFGKIQDTFVIHGTHTKNGKSRRVYLSQSAMNALDRYVSANFDVEADTDKPLFGLTPNYATTMVKKIMVEAGVNASSHSLRRTAAEKLQEHGVHPAHLQQVLSHSTLSITMRYLDTSTTNITKAVQVLSW